MIKQQKVLILIPIIALTLLGFFYVPAAYARTWMQADWTGGETTAVPFPNAVNNIDNWTKFYDTSYAVFGASASGENKGVYLNGITTTNTYTTKEDFDSIKSSNSTGIYTSTNLTDGTYSLINSISDSNLYASSYNGQVIFPKNTNIAPSAAYTTDGTIDTTGIELTDGNVTGDQRFYTTLYYAITNKDSLTVTLDLGSVVDNIKTIGTYIAAGKGYYDSGVNRYLYNPSKIEIQYSDDNESWTTAVIDTSIANTEHWEEQAVNISARYIKLIYTAYLTSTANNFYYVGINEVAIGVEPCPTRYETKPILFPSGLYSLQAFTASASAGVTAQARTQDFNGVWGEYKTVINSTLSWGMITNTLQSQGVGAAGDKAVQFRFISSSLQDLSLTDFSYSFLTIPTELDPPPNDSNTLFYSGFDYHMYPQKYSSYYYATKSYSTYYHNWFYYNLSYSFGTRLTQGSAESSKFDNALHVCDTNNILYNSNFSNYSCPEEVCNFSNWTKGTETSNSIYYNIVNDDQWSPTTLYLNMAGADSGLYQETTDIYKNADYTLTAFYRAATEAQAACDLQIISYDKDGVASYYDSNTDSWGSDEATNLNTTNLTNYLKSSITFTTPADIEKLRINVKNATNLNLAYLILEEGSNNMCSYTDKKYKPLQGNESGLQALWHLDEESGNAKNTCNSTQGQYDEVNTAATDLFDGTGVMDTAEGWANWGTSCQGTTTVTSVNGENMLQRSACASGGIQVTDDSGFYYNNLSGFATGETYTLSAYYVPSGVGKSIRAVIACGSNNEEVIPLQYHAEEGTFTDDFTPGYGTCKIIFQCKTTFCNVTVDDVTVTCKTCPSINNVEGRIKKAFDFSSAYAFGRGRTTFDVNNAANFTVEAWVKPDTLTGVERDIVTDRTAGIDANAFSLYIDSSNKYAFSVWNNNGTKYTITALNAEDANTIKQWKHLVAKYIETTACPTSSCTGYGAYYRYHNIYLYVDGVLQSSLKAWTQIKGASGPLPTDAVNGAGTVWIGTSPTLSRYFDGKIDEVAIYNTDIGYTNIIKKATPAGVLYNAAGYPTQTANLPYGTNTPGTIEFWFKPFWDGNDWNSHYLFDMQATDADTNAITIEKTDNNDLRFRLADSTADGFLEINHSVDDVNFAKDTWHHIAATWSGGGSTIELYLDGVKVGTQTNTSMSAFLSSLDTYFYLGNAKNDWSHPANGYFDGLRISKKVRDYLELEGEYKGYAILLSSPFDAKSTSVKWEKILWLTNDIGTTKFQLRTAPDNSGTPGTWTSWMGPDGTNNSYFETPDTDEDPTQLPEVLTDLTNDEWIQYKLYMKSNDGVLQPILKGIYFQFNAPSFNLTSNTHSSITAVAGTPFPVTITMNEENQEKLDAYSGLKSIKIDGANASPSGAYKPQAALTEDMADSVDFGATLSGVNFESGQATVWVTLVNAEEGARTLYVTSMSDNTVTTSPLTITSLAPAAASKLVWGTEPAASVEAGQTWSFTVKIQDLYGNLRSSDTNNVTVAPSEGSFAAGNLTKAAVAGIVTFNDLSYTVSKPEGISITASSGDLTPVTKTGIVVKPDLDSYYFIVDSVIPTMKAGDKSDVRITVKDQYGNAGTTFSGPVTFTSDDPEADLPAFAIYTASEADQGVKTFSQAVSFKSVTTPTTLHWVKATCPLSSAQNLGQNITVTGQQSNITVTVGDLSNGNIIPSALKNFNGYVDECIAGASDVFPTGGDPVDAVSPVKINFTVPSTIPFPANGKLVVTFPGNFTFNYGGTTTAVVDSGLSGGTYTVNAAGQVVTITRANGTKSSNTSNTNISMHLTNVRNPNEFGSTGTYKIQMQNAVGAAMAEQNNLDADTLFGVKFSTPSAINNGENSFNVGQDDVPVEWEESGVTGVLRLRYFNSNANDGNGDYLSCYNDLAAVVKEPNTGSSALWDIGASMPILNTYRLGMYETGKGFVGYSEVFSIAGGLTIDAPTESQNISMDVPFLIEWTMNGYFVNGNKVLVSTNSTDGINGEWKAITAYSDANATVPATNADNNGIQTGSIYWLPNNDLEAGSTNVWLKVIDANTSNPPTYASVKLTVSDIKSVDFTLPAYNKRINPSIKIGADLGIGGQDAFEGIVSNVKIEYLSKKTGGYVICKNPLGQEASNVLTSNLPFTWRVPDDVFPDGGSRIKITAVPESGITGLLFQESSGFTIFGEINLTYPNQTDSESFPVNDPQNRIPITWSSSESITGAVIQFSTQYSTSNESIWKNASSATAGEVYNAAIGGAAGYNLSNGDGTAWWQPLVTSGETYIRICDADDSLTCSVIPDFGFRVRGVSLVGISEYVDGACTSNLISLVKVGQTVCVKGSGSTDSGSAKLYYSTDVTFPDDPQMTHLITPAWNQVNLSGSIDGTFNYQWVIPDEISNDVYLRITDPANEENTYGVSPSPFAISGILTVNTPVIAWVVGDTNKTITGTVTGNIDIVDLQYATAASPVENDWANFATGVSIGDNSGTNETAFTIPEEVFTVPDAISVASFKIRLKDATPTRHANIIAKSAASNGFQVKGAVSITSPVTDDSWYVGRPATISYNITGSNFGDFKIYYSYAKGASAPSNNAFTTWVPILNTTSSANPIYFAPSGTTAAFANSYSWGAIADVVGILLDPTETQLVNSIDEQDPNVYEIAENACWMQIKVESTNAGVSVVSAPFRAKYYKIYFNVVDKDSQNPLQDLSVSESWIGNKPEWNKTDWSVASSSTEDGALRYQQETSSQRIPRYYPYYALGQYRTTFTKKAVDPSASPYSGFANWDADINEKTVKVEVNTNPETVYIVNAQTHYDYLTHTLHVATWLEKSGKQVVDDLGIASVVIKDTNSTTLNQTDLSKEGPSDEEIGIYWFDWNTETDEVKLNPGDMYTIIATIASTAGTTYQSTITFSLNSQSSYEVRLESAYNAVTQQVTILSSLYENGSLMTKNTGVGLSYCRLLDTEETDLSGDLAGAQYSIKDSTNAAFVTKWNAGDSLETGEVYNILAKISYNGNEVTGTAKFMVSDSGGGASVDLTEITSKVNEVRTALLGENGIKETVENVDTDVSELKNDVAANEATQVAYRNDSMEKLNNIDSNVETIKTDVGSILEDTSATIPTLLTEEFSKGVQAEIVTRGTKVVPGATTTIKFRTKSLLNFPPTIRVYNAGNQLVLEDTPMVEIGTTGIYSYDLTVLAEWGTGEFTVLCKDTENNAIDSMALEVGLDSIDVLADRMDTLDDNMQTLISSVATVTTNTESIMTDVSQLLADVGIVKTDVTAMGTKVDSVDGKVDAMNIAMATMGTDVDSILTGTNNINTRTINMDNNINTILSNIGSIGGDGSGDGTGIVGDLSALSNDIASVKDMVTAMDTRTTAIDSNVDTTLTKVNTIDTNTVGLQTTLNTVDANTTGLQAGLNTVGTKIDGVSAKADTIIEKVNTIDSTTLATQQKVNSIDDKTTTISTGITSLGTKADAITDDMAIVKNKVDDVGTKVDEVTGEITTISTQIGTIFTEVEQVQTTADQIKTGVDTIDTTTQEIVLNVAGVGTKIDNVETKVDSLSTQITGMETSMTTMGTKVDNVSTIVGGFGEKVDGIDNAVQSVNTTVSGMGTKIDSMDNIVGSLETNMAAMGVKVDNVSTIVGGFGEKVDNIESTVNTMGSTVSDMGTKVTNMDGIVGTMETTINGMDTTLNDTADKVTTVSEIVGGFEGKVTNIETAVNTMGTTVSDMGTKVTGMEGVVNTMGGQVDNMVSTVGGLNSKVDTINANTLGIQGDLTAINSKAENIQTGILDLDSKSTGIQADVSDIKSDTATLSTDLITLKTNTGTLKDDIAMVDTKAAQLNTALDEVITSIGAGQGTLYDRIISVGSEVDSAKKEIVTYVDRVKSTIGNEFDTAGTNTVFGQIASIESSVTLVGVDALNASNYAKNARNQAMEVISMVNEIKDELLTGASLDTIQATVARVPEIASALSQLQEAMNNASQSTVDGTGVLEEVKSVLTNLQELAKQKGVDGDISVALSKDVNEFNPKDMVEVKKAVTELKALMANVRELLDKQVNQPVIKGWME